MIRKSLLTILLVLAVVAMSAQKPVQVLNLENGEYLVSTNSLGSFRTGGLYMSSVGLSCIVDSIDSKKSYLYVYGRAEINGELKVSLKNGFTMSFSPSFSTHCKDRLGLIKKVDIYCAYYSISESELRAMCKTGVAEMKVRRDDTWLTKVWKNDDMTHWLKRSDELITERIAKLRVTK